MKVSHVVPAKESRRHERAIDCPCGPHQSVSKALGEQPDVVITHHPIKVTRSKP